MDQTNNQQEIENSKHQKEVKYLAIFLGINNSRKL